MFRRSPGWELFSAEKGRDVIAEPDHPAIIVIAGPHRLHAAPLFGRAVGARGGSFGGRGAFGAPRSF